MKTIKLSILIPVRNEGVNITSMIKILTSLLEIPHEILVIYDSADDDTAPVVRKLSKKLPQVKLVQNNLGVGVANAIRSGVMNAKGKYILTFVTDDFGPVMAIEDMVYLLDNGCQFVSATRYAHGGRRLGGSIIQGVLSRTGNNVVKKIMGTTFSDSTTGMKMFEKELFHTIKLESRVGWAVIFEFTIKAQMQGLRLGEVPIVSIDRLYGGKSTFKLGPWLKEYVKWFIYAIKNLRKRKIKQKVAVRIPKNIS